jgi:hypothetical protein
MFAVFQYHRSSCATCGHSGSPSRRDGALLHRNQSRRFTESAISVHRAIVPFVQRLSTAALHLRQTRCLAASHHVVSLRGADMLTLMCPLRSPPAAFAEEGTSQCSSGTYTDPSNASACLACSTCSSTQFAAKSCTASNNTVCAQCKSASRPLPHSLRAVPLCPCAALDVLVIKHDLAHAV